MTLDEAIEHAEEVAEQNEFETRIYDELNRPGDEEYRNNSCQCAFDQRQLAEWLRELKELRKQNKELKTLLQKALDDLDWLNEYSKIENGERCTFTEECENCPLNASESYCGWKYQAQALAAIQKGV